MNSITSKKHYLTNSMNGFKNILGTKITSVVNYSTEPEILYINMYVNPTVDPYTSVEKVYVAVVYNMATDSFAVKASGKGSRKHGKFVKDSASQIIMHLVKEANDTFKGDVSDAVFITECYAHDRLKKAGYSVAILNEVNFNISHGGLTVEKTIELVDGLVNKAETVETEFVNTGVVSNKDQRRGPKKFFMATGVSPMDSNDFSWAEKGWIYEGYESETKGVYKLENPLERFSYEELFREDMVKEISEELYNRIYKMNCKEEGWGDEETYELEEIMKEVFKDEYEAPIKYPVEMIAMPGDGACDWKIKTPKLLDSITGLTQHSFDSEGRRVYFATHEAYKVLSSLYTIEVA